MEPTLRPSDLEDALIELSTANRGFDRRYPGPAPKRQPVHTVYGGAHLFKAATASRIGRVALGHLETYYPDAAAMARQLGFSDELAETVYGRVVEKLRREPVEDFRIDFEDGFGHRGDAEEDAAAITAAGEVAKGMDEGSLPPFIGIRIKPLSTELHPRAIRTLDLFLSALAEATGGALPPGFVVTLPKVVAPEQVTALVELLGMLEKKTAIERRTLRLELMIETPQSLLDPRGRANLPQLVEAASGRCVAAHFGVYDYTASLNVTAAYQHIHHPACDHARHLMQVALAGTGVWLSDGATNIMPVGPHRAAKGGPPLDEAQERENREVVYRAAKLNFENVRHSLEHGFYQGWDLHPAQLPIRYAAVYSFFLEGLDAMATRLGSFIDKAAQATLAGDVFDDAATGQALLNYFLAAINCGAVTEREASRSGLSLEELRSRSFAQIVDGRNKGR